MPASGRARRDKLGPRCYAPFALKTAVWVVGWGIALQACGGRALTDVPGSAAAATGGAAGSNAAAGGDSTTFAGASATCDSCVGGGSNAASGVTQLATAMSATALAVDANNVYWIDGSPSLTKASVTVKRCAISGCGGEPTTIWQTPDDILFFAVAGGSLWWTDTVLNSVDDPTNIVSCPVAGCAATTVLASLGASPPRAFGAGAAGVAWAIDSGTFACSLTGCPNNAPTQLFTLLGSEAGYVIQNSQLFGINLEADGGGGFAQVNHLFSCPLSGCANEPTVLGTVNASGPLALDAENAYWIYPGIANAGFSGLPIPPPTEWGDGAIYECPLSGCVGEPTALMNYPSWYRSASIAADASGVYWTAGVPNGSTSSLVRCTGAGCGMEPTLLATVSASTTPAIALGAENVYWIDQGLGAIMMRKK